MAASRLLAGLVVVVLTACQSNPPISGAVHWYRNSAEMKAVYEQTFAVAVRELRARAEGRPRGGWAVIMDVDETVLDNSGYVVEFGRYTPRTWDIWTARGVAPALPGAVRFTRTVREELGGVVVLVTNREQKACADTEANLARVGITYDRILCKSGTSDKNPRFAAVRSGEGGLPPLEVLMWLGDNIEDFPGMSQQQYDLTEFGTRFFVLPNPSYGSWEALPRR
ncbi:MAG: HAD family acid phosphatase [Pseudomonadota bacterium]|jgi:5'-nucleotidase (lipoprotein e(P4) family)